MMKKIIYILFIFSFLNSYSQISDNTDEFTGEKITSTKWQKLISKGLYPSSLRYRFLKNDNTISFNARIVLNGGNVVFAVDEGFEIILLLEDGSKVVLNSTQRIVSSRGGAADGFAGSADFGATIKYKFVNKDDLNKLQTVKIEKIRVYTDEGYFENKVKSKNKDKFIDNLKEIRNY